MVLHTLLAGALAVLDKSFITHLDHASLTLYRGDVLLGNHGHLIYGPRVSSVPPDPYELYIKNDISCMCAGFLHGGSQLMYNATILSAAKKLHESYQQYLSAIIAHPKQTNITLTDFVHSFSPYSCTLFDYPRMTVYMVSDTVGSIPLWYTLAPRSSFVVTSGNQSPVTSMLISSPIHYPLHQSSLPITSITSPIHYPLHLFLRISLCSALVLSGCSPDLLGAQRLGYDMPLSPLGPGQIVALYVSINTVDYLRWSPQQLALQVQAQTLAQTQTQTQSQTPAQSQSQMHADTSHFDTDEIYNSHNLDNHDEMPDGMYSPPQLDLA